MLSSVWKSESLSPRFKTPTEHIYAPALVHMTRPTEDMNLYASTSVGEPPTRKQGGLVKLGSLTYLLLPEIHSFSNTTGAQQYSYGHVSVLLQRRKVLIMWKLHTKKSMRE